MSLQPTRTTELPEIGAVHVLAVDIFIAVQDAYYPRTGHRIGLWQELSTAQKCAYIAAAKRLLESYRPHETRSPDGDGLMTLTQKVQGIGAEASIDPHREGLPASVSDDRAGTAKDDDGGSLNGPSRLGASREHDTGGEIIVAAGSEPAESHHASVLAFPQPQDGEVL